MLRFDAKLLLKETPNGTMVACYATPKSQIESIGIVKLDYNIADVYNVVLTTNQIISCTLDQIVLTKFGDKTIFELMEGNTHRNTRTYQLIGPNGTTPRTKEIYKVDKNTVFSIQLEKPDYYFEVSGVLVKGKQSERQKQGKG